MEGLEVRLHISDLICPSSLTPFNCRATSTSYIPHLHEAGTEAAEAPSLAHVHFNATDPAPSTSATITDTAKPKKAAGWLLPFQTGTRNLEQAKMINQKRGTGGAFVLMTLPRDKR